MSFSNDYQVQACYANHEGSTGRNPQKMRLWITLGKSLPVAYSRMEEYADRTKGIENNCLIAWSLEAIPTKDDNPPRQIIGMELFKEAQIHCWRSVHSSPRLIFPMIATRGPFFCRFCRYLHMISVATRSKSTERVGCYPQMQKGQCFEDGLLMMCKSCGKKCANPPYLFISIM